MAKTPTKPPKSAPKPAVGDKAEPTVVTQVKAVVNLSELQTVTGVDYTKVISWTKEPDFPTEPTRGPNNTHRVSLPQFYRWWAERAVAKALEAQPGAGAGGETERERVEIRLKAAQADMAEERLREYRRELIKFSHAEQAIMVTLAVIKRRLEGVCTTVCAEMEGDRRAKAAFENTYNTELHDSLRQAAIGIDEVLSGNVAAFLAGDDEGDEDGEPEE